MKRLAIIIALTVLAAAQAAWAQPRPGGGGGPGGGNLDERRAERQPHRRDQIERRGQQGERGQPGASPGGPHGGQRMTPDERRALRDQVRDHGRDIYRDPAKR